MEKAVTRRAFAEMVGTAGAFATLSGLAAGAGKAPSVAAAAEGEMSDEEAFAAVLDRTPVNDDLVCDDGSVVPAVYLNLRNKMNRIGLGLGSEVSTETSANWGFFMELFTPDEAACYLEMPDFILFTAEDWAASSGRDEQDCLAVLEDLASRGLLNRFRRGGIPYFHTLTYMHGYGEFNMGNYEKDGFLMSMAVVPGADFDRGRFDSQTPLYRSVPLGVEVVGEEKILPYNDWEALVERNDTFAISPCQCRNSARILGVLECDHPLGTCISLGEQAEYYIENGIGEPATREEVKAVIQSGIDSGLVVQMMNSRVSDVICQCHSDCCTLLKGIKALGGDCDCMETISPYELKVDLDACLACGACAQRCPMLAVTMDGEDGKPTVDATCVRCGQCVPVCPAGARVLTAKPSEEQFTYAADMVEDYKRKSIARMKKGYIQDFLG